MDVLELGIKRGHTDAAQGLPWEEAVIRVNGRDLLELVSQAELPFAQAEGHPDLAGAYVGISAGDAFLPSRHLLGEPDALLSDLVRSGNASKPALLMCECGEPGCWPFCARVDMHVDVVQWSEFEQLHRVGWGYDGLGPFLFDRKQYEAALTRPSAP